MAEIAHPAFAASRPHVLVVDDSDSLRAMLLAYLRDQPWSIAAVGSAQEALQAIDRQRPDLILLDMQLPDAQGLELFQAVRAHAPRSAIVVITAFGSIGLAVEATRAGALDFLEKPVTRERLVQSVRNALERVLLERRMERLAGELAGSGLHGLLGASQAMQGTIKALRAAAASSAPILLMGEPGSGARLAARAVHRESPRSDRALASIACAQDDVVFQLAAALDDPRLGTLVLLEVDALPPVAQAMLLDAVSRPQREWRPIACSTRATDSLAGGPGNLRADLVHRLHVVPIRLPPLRWREDDVLLLARHFLAIDAAAEGKPFGGFDAAAVVALRRHTWPGNVAELRNAMRAAAALFSGGMVGLDALPPALQEARDSAAETAIEPLWQVEQRTIRNAVAACGGDHATAAARLQITLDELERRLLRQAGTG
jgi:two-component system repressor protein LuxO